MPKPGPRTTYKYSDQFKATEVRLSELPGVAVQDVAASLYIHPFMLSRWQRECAVYLGISDRMRNIAGVSNVG